MKRYRFTNFVLDSTRSLLKMTEGITQEQRDTMLKELKIKYGEYDFDNKLKRYLQLETGNIRLETEYHSVLSEVEDAYVCGYYYPALTASCCLGERIFNKLILSLKEYYKDSQTYKDVYRKEQIQNWDEGIEVLLDWGIIGRDLVNEYRSLHKTRIASIHLRDVGDFQGEALSALQKIMKITDSLFGLRPDIFFWVPGEPYIRKEKEKEPIVKEFFIPSCTLLGYKYTVTLQTESLPNVVFRYNDPHGYGGEEITDEEFRRLREEWRNSRTGTY